MISKELIDKLINGTREERVFLCKKDFELFFCYYFVDYIKFPFAPFHYDMFQDIQDLLDGKYREVAWVMFRESAKTSIAKGFLTYLVCYRIKMYPNTDSFDKENAERILFDLVIDLQTNPRIKADFGELFNSKRNPDEIQQKRVNNFVTNHHVRVEAHSTQESVRGRLSGNQRPDFLLMDDFETNKTKDSKAYTEQVIAHIDEFKSGLDSQAIVLYLCNYITEYGSVNALKERAKTDLRLKYREVPAIIDDKPTWPAKYAMTDVEAKATGKVSLEDKKRQLGSQVFNAEMLNMPIDESTQEFPRKWFKYKKLEDVLAMRTRKFATIDSALSKGAKSDSTGVTKNYVDVDNNWYFDSREYRFNSKGLIDLIFMLHDEGFEKIGIEETAFVEAIEPFFDDECRLRNKYPYVVALKHGGVMKETRIRGLIPRYERGTIYHIEGKCEELETQLVRFPKLLHDDVADSAQYQNKIAEPPYPEIRQAEFNAVIDDAPQYSDIGI